MSDTHKEDGGFDVLTSSGNGFHLVTRLLRYGPGGMAQARPAPSIADQAAAIAAKGRGPAASVKGGRAISPKQSRIVAMADAAARGAGLGAESRGNVDAAAGQLAVALRNLFD